MFSRLKAIKKKRKQAVKNLLLHPDVAELTAGVEDGGEAVEEDRMNDDSEVGEGGKDAVVGEEIGEDCMEEGSTLDELVPKP